SPPRSAHVCLNACRSESTKRLWCAMPGSACHSAHVSPNAASNADRAAPGKEFLGTVRALDTRGPLDPSAFPTHSAPGAMRGASAASERVQVPFRDSDSTWELTRGLCST